MDTTNDKHAEASAAPMQLTASDIHIIDQFRRQKSTAVLTILFTDIKGFTNITEEFGEEYSNKLRRHHDEIVVPVIERDGGGRVIKHIGDSVMAVFSEPSTAVARSLEVQEKLAAFNIAHPGLAKIEVRMGLHTGQVTTEDNVSGDVFGRHVNRAARVEALADGGQVLVTYPVFDSARGWLNEQSDIPAAWEKHGCYALKGIAEPIEVYEAYNPKRITPKAPAGAIVDKGHSKIRIVIAACALVAVAALATFFGLRFAGGTPEVSLVDYNSDWAKMWDGTPFRVGGEPGQHIRPVLTPLKAGHYLLTADTSQIVRFFAPFDVARDKNVLEIRFERDELPGISRRIEYEKGAENKLEESREEEYFSYDANMQKHDHKAKIAMTLAAAPDAADEKKINFACDYTITLDGKEIASGRVEDTHMADDMEVTRPPNKILWSDDFHFYYLSYYMSGSSAEFSIEANFADYKDR